MRNAFLLLIITLFFSLSFPILVFSQERETFEATPQPTLIEYPLPYPGILPDHPLYFLKNLRDKFLLFITREPGKKSQLNLLLADKNLAMGELLWEREKYELAIISLKRGEEYLLNSVAELSGLKTKEQLLGVIDKLKLAIEKHEEILKKLSSSSRERELTQKLGEILNMTHQARQQFQILK